MNGKQPVHESDLQAVLDEMRAMASRFQPARTGEDLASEDRALFKRLVLEAKSCLDSDLGLTNDFSFGLMRMSNLPSFGMLNPPSREQLQEAIQLVEGGINLVRRKLNRPTAVHSGVQRPLYVDPSRIAELQGLRQPKWDPARLIRMLQELNLAHANGMDIATAMLVRAITDHVPPIFGKEKFADVAAQHSAGSASGRSFKGSMAHLTDSMKHVADGLLHVHIRTRETLPSSTQVDFRQSLDVLLGEVVRLLR